MFGNIVTTCLSGIRRFSHTLFHLWGDALLISSAYATPCGVSRTASASVATRSENVAVFLVCAHAISRIAAAAFGIRPKVYTWRSGRPLVLPFRRNYLYPRSVVAIFVPQESERERESRWRLYENVRGEAAL